jgi:hypothetical protein
MIISSTALPQSLEGCPFGDLMYIDQTQLSSCVRLAFWILLLEAMTPILILDAVLARWPGLEMARLSVFLIFQWQLKYEDRAWKYLAGVGGRAFRVWTIYLLFIFPTKVVVLWDNYGSSKAVIVIRSFSPHIALVLRVSIGSCTHFWQPTTLPSKLSSWFQVTGLASSWRYKPVRLLGANIEAPEASTFRRGCSLQVATFFYVFARSDKPVRAQKRNTTVSIRTGGGTVGWLPYFPMPMLSLY